MRYKNIQYDYDCAVELLTACNFHCEYCSGPRVSKVVSKEKGKQQANALINFFNNSGKTWLIGMSGGEPTIHPYFYYMIENLRDKHFFYFFSNLSFNLDKFINIVPPERVQYIKLSLHEEADENEFIYKFGILHEKGYNPILIIVSTPESFPKIERVANICKQNDYNFGISVLAGPYRGKNYPADFTIEQENFIKLYTHEPGSLMTLHERTQGGLDTYGHYCKAGYSSFCLKLGTGNITVCESDSTVIGNIYSGTFAPFKEKRRCTVINGCIGYFRNIQLPDNYMRFYNESGGYYELKEEEIDLNRLEKLREIFDENVEKEVSSLKQNSLKAINEILKNKKFMFWGAGIHGTKLLRELEKYNPALINNFIGFVDSLKDRQKMKVLGYEVYSPADKEIIESKAQLILVASHAFENQILETSMKYEFKIPVLGLYKDVLSVLGIRNSVF